jgi:hypothetical protein
MRRLAKLTAKASLTLVACGVAAGIALTVGVAAGSDQPSPATSATHISPSPAATVPSDLASSYRLLTSAASTVLPTSLASNLEWAAGYGVNPSLGRDAGSIGVEHLWLVPGSSQSCLELASGSTACGPNTLVEQQGVWAILKPVSGAAPTMYGIVPDGATVSGDPASAEVSQSGNAVRVTPSSSVPGQITLHTGGGTTIELPVPAAAGRSQ